MQFLRTRLVTEEEWRAAHAKTGSIYFIRDEARDCVKVGHSRDPSLRMQVLQVGNASKLALVGVIAAPIEIEKHIHSQLMEGHASGEWFYDRGVVSQFLMSMTQGEPICRHIWSLVDGVEVHWKWDAENNRHIRYVWNAAAGEWQSIGYLPSDANDNRSPRAGWDLITWEPPKE